MIVNVLFILVILAFLVLILFVMFRKTNEVEEEVKIDEFSLDYLKGLVEDTFNTIANMRIEELNYNKAETEKAEFNQKKLARARSTCAFGDIGSKDYIKDYISEIIQTKGHITDENINSVIPFDTPSALSVMDKYDIILYAYKSMFGLDAFGKLIDQYQLDAPKPADFNEYYYEITEQDILNVYNDVQFELNFSEKLDILSQRLYQMILGHGVIDETRDMNIDGISCGISGIPETMYFYGQDPSINKDNPSRPLKDYNAIWCMYRGKTIQLSFLGFGTGRELTRVAKNIYRYNNPGQLSADKGFIINTMMDGCRVVTVRPNFAESWGFWVRKFGSADKLSIDQLITGGNSDMAIQTIMWLAKGRLSLAITGGQGCGKTTFLGSMLQFLPPWLTIRVHEIASELWLRKVYPRRNIESFTETATVSSQMSLDMQKKTDCNITILGEISDDTQASMAIQIGRVGSDQLVFTSHHKTASSLVLGIRDSIIRAGGSSDVSITERDVAHVLNFDIHLTKERDGFRHIERVTEIIPLDLPPYPEYRGDNPTKEFYNLFREYAYCSTDREIFETKDILHWDKQIGSFVFDNVPTDKTVNQIRECIAGDQISDFDNYIKKLEKLISQPRKQVLEAL